MKSKPPFVLLINQSFISDTSIGYKGSTIRFSVRALLINNTDDTLVYANPLGHESKFFLTDDKNITVADNPLLRQDSIWPDTVRPHHSGYMDFLYFQFKKMPDTTFGLRIGMRLLKWNKNYKTISAGSTAISKAPVLWSDIQLVKTDRKHHNYDKTPEEYKKQYEKLVDKLNENDRHNYTLSIYPQQVRPTKDNIVSSFDSVAYRDVDKQFDLEWITIKLSNKSGHTLTYMTWLCSWEKMYKTNNKDVSLMERFCLGNYPITTTLGAHSSSILNIPMLFNKKTSSPTYKFKVGMVLLRDGIIPSSAFSNALPIFKRDANYLIWSNELEVPAKK